MGTRREIDCGNRGGTCDLTTRRKQHDAISHQAGHVNLKGGGTYVFRTPHLPLDRPECDWPIADRIVAATAAPTYIPQKQLPNGKDNADGGLWAIDPGVVGLAEAARVIDEDNHCEGQAGRWDDVHARSIGTGQATYALAPPGGDADSAPTQPYKRALAVTREELPGT